MIVGAEGTAGAPLTLRGFIACGSAACRVLIRAAFATRGQLLGQVRVDTCFRC